MRTKLITTVAAALLLSACASGKSERRGRHDDNLSYPAAGSDVSLYAEREKASGPGLYDRR
jgi:hypothetical protein